MSSVREYIPADECCVCRQRGRHLVLHVCWPCACELARAAEAEYVAAETARRNAPCEAAEEARS